MVNVWRNRVIELEAIMIRVLLLSLIMSPVTRKPITSTTYQIDYKQRFTNSIWKKAIFVKMFTNQTTNLMNIKINRPKLNIHPLKSFTNKFKMNMQKTKLQNRRGVTLIKMIKISKINKIIQEMTITASQVFLNRLL